MYLQAGIAARSIVVDKFTNHLHIFNVLDSVQVPNYPLLLSELSFLTILRRENNDPSEQTCDVKIYVGNEVVAAAQLLVKFENFLVSRQILNFQQFVITSPGNLKYEMTTAIGQKIEFEILVTQAGRDPQLPFSS
jgi:hypothetical protein